MSEIIVRKATMADLDVLKNLADAHKHELGFVLRPALAKSIAQGEVITAQISKDVVGFAEYHNRRDAQTTLYHIVVQPDHRGQGVGQQLIHTLVQDSIECGKEFVQLKCPVNLKANGFYKQLGFSCVGVQPRKHRDLAIWQLYCSSITSNGDEIVVLEFSCCASPQ